MTGLSLIVGAVLALTSAPTTPWGTSASRQPLEVLIEDGAILQRHELSVPLPIFSPVEDLILLRDLPRSIDVHLAWFGGLEADDLRYLRGARLKRLSWKPRTGDSGLENLRHCERIEEFCLVFPEDAPFFASFPPELLDNLKAIPGLRMLQLDCFFELPVDVMARLGELSEIEQLQLWSAVVSDDGLGRLGGMTRLRRLTILGGAQLTAAGVARLGELPNLESLRLSVNDEALAGLKHVAGLKVLELASTENTDAGVANLAGLAALESLDLSRTQATGDCLRHVARLPSQKYLKIANLRAIDAGVAHLAELPNLESLDLPHANARNADLKHVERLSRLKTLVLAGAVGMNGKNAAHLAEMPNVETLDLSRSDVKDEDLMHVGRLPKLKSLNLDDTAITDAGVAHLAHLTGLESLDLSRTKVTDDGLGHLGRMTELKTLDLNGTAITDAGVERLVNLVAPEPAAAPSAELLSQKPSSKKPSSSVRDDAPPTLAKVESLSLWSTFVAGLNLQKLARLPCLESLNVSGPWMTNATVERIATLDNLRAVSVGGLHVDGDGLMYLARLPHLELLTIPSHTPVYQKDITKLRAIRTPDQPILGNDSASTY